jgi:hypothetical protein
VAVKQLVLPTDEHAVAGCEGERQPVAACQLAKLRHGDIEHLGEDRDRDQVPFREPHHTLNRFGCVCLINSSTLMLLRAGMIGPSGGPVTRRPRNGCGSSGFSTERM